MARKARPKPTSSQDMIREAALSGIAQLWEKHESEFVAFREEAENKSGVINFAVSVDESKSEPVIEVKVRFSQAITDAIKTTLDPNQTKFDFVNAKRGPGRPSSNSDDVEAEEAAAE